MTSSGNGAGWRIDPLAAGSAIADVKTGIEGLDDAEVAVETVIAAAAAVVGPKTSAALASLARNPFLSQINEVRTAVEHAADQTALALDAYAQGDEEMATHYAGGVGR